MTNSRPRSLLPVVASALLTLGFLGCMSETQLLNSPAANGGEEGENNGAGMAGRASAGRAGHPTAGRAGASPGTGGTGGTSGAGAGVGGVGGVAGVAGGEQGGAGFGNGGVAGGSGTSFGGYPGSSGGGGEPVAGSAGTAGGAGAPPDCTQGDPLGCSGSEPAFCLDLPFDACGSPNTACPGVCASSWRGPDCSGAAPSDPCAEGYQCVIDESSDSGAVHRLCADERLPECATDDVCPEGYSCVDGGQGRLCAPERADCHPTPHCDSQQIPDCPIGYTASEAGPCNYVCVPIDRCGCANDFECVLPSVCDLAEQRCKIAEAPQPRCLQPFDPGPCDAAFPVYAFIDGQCQRAVWGGCTTNDNRFDSAQACISACVGAPLQQECPEGWIAATMCPACGAGGGCPNYGVYCAKPCSETEPCEGAGLTCYQGVCQAVGCT